MPDWFSNSYVTNIVSAVVAAIILGVLVFFWKRIVTVSEFVWNRIRTGHRTQTRDMHPNRTQRMVIHFFVVLPPNKLKSLTLHIDVIDQLSGEHSLRRIKLKPQIAQPATTGQP